jgi:hypothetical protein
METNRTSHRKNVTACEHLHQDHEGDERTLGGRAAERKSNKSMPAMPELCNAREGDITRVFSFF